MYKEIQIGETMTPLVVNGITPLVYKRVFNENIFEAFQSGKQETDAVEFAGKLAYIMRAAGADEDLSKLSYEGYWKWLESLGWSDIATAAADIVMMYSESEKASVEPKKKAGRQKDSSQ